MKIIKSRKEQQARNRFKITMEQFCRLKFFDPEAATITTTKKILDLTNSNFNSSLIHIIKMAS